MTTKNSQSDTEMFAKFGKWFAVPFYGIAFALIFAVVIGTFTTKYVKNTKYTVSKITYQKHYRCFPTIAYIHTTDGKTIERVLGWVNDMRLEKGSTFDVPETIN